MKAAWSVCLAWAGLVAVVLGQTGSGKSSDYMELPGYGQIPTCSMECLLLIPDKTGCELTNQTCVCEHAATSAVQSMMLSCIQKVCSVRLSLETQNATATACKFPIRDRAPGYNALSIALVIIAGICVIQRFAFKLYSKLPLWWDDWLVLLTILTVVASTIINIRGAVKNGVGKDVWTLTPDNITGFMKAFHILGSMYFVQITLVKLSLLFFYLRIFPTLLTRRLLWGTIIFNVILAIVFCFLGIFHCRPLSYFWYQWDGEHKGTCNNLITVTTTNGAISIAVDFWMLAVPLAELKSLNLNLKKKIGVGLMFLVGTFVTVISIVRLVYIIRFGEGGTNPTWDYADISTWSVVEINVGVICACMPAVRMLLVRVFPRFLGSTQQGTHEYEHKSNPWKSSNNASIVERTPNRGTPPERILYQKSFAVEYSETDETRLVEMQDMDAESAGSKPNAKVYYQT